MIGFQLAGSEGPLSPVQSPRPSLQSPFQPPSSSCTHKWRCAYPWQWWMLWIWGAVTAAITHYTKTYTVLTTLMHSPNTHAHTYSKHVHHILYILHACTQSLTFHQGWTWPWWGSQSLGWSWSTCAPSPKDPLQSTGGWSDLHRSRSRRLNSKAITVEDVRRHGFGVLAGSFVE